MERRRTTRRVPDPEEPIACARLRTGAELTVINVSGAGVLVEGAVRLLPGRHLEVRLATRHGRVLVRCRVVRSFVWHLEAAAVRYRSALAFDRQVDVGAGGEALSGPPDGDCAGEGSRFPDSAPVRGVGERAERVTPENPARAAVASRLVAHAGDRRPRGSSRGGGDDDD